MFELVIIANITVVGHVPYNLAPIFTEFLKKGFNKGMVKVTGDMVNRGAGYGLEIPCVYMLHGPTPYIEWIKCILQERSIV